MAGRSCRCAAPHPGRGLMLQCSKCHSWGNRVKGTRGFSVLFPVTVGEYSYLPNNTVKRMSSPSDQEVLSLGFSPWCSVGHVGEGMPVEHLLQGPKRALQWERLWQWSGKVWNILECSEIVQNVPECSRMVWFYSCSCPTLLSSFKSGQHWLGLQFSHLSRRGDSVG